LILFYFIFISNVKHFVSIQQMFPFGKRLCLFNPLFACFPFLFFFSCSQQWKKKMWLILIFLPTPVVWTPSNATTLSSPGFKY
jgi:hypothetical protein